jgi:DNA-binding transcriptional ArsR family regulator
LVNTIRESFHPNAYLELVKNVKGGLSTRTEILDIIENQPLDASSLAKEIGLSYGTVMHHLRLLENEEIVNRKGKRPYFWIPTGLGQKRLVG